MSGTAPETFWPAIKQWIQSDRSSPAPNLTCTICQENDLAVIGIQRTANSEQMLILRCGHVFGDVCLTSYFRSQKERDAPFTCPLCRDPQILHCTIGATRAPQLEPPAMRSQFIIAPTDFTRTWAQYNPGTKPPLGVTAVTSSEDPAFTMDLLQARDVDDVPLTVPEGNTSVSGSCGPCRYRQATSIVRHFARGVGALAGRKGEEEMVREDFAAPYVGVFEAAEKAILEPEETGKSKCWPVDRCELAVVLDRIEEVNQVGQI